MALNQSINSQSVFRPFSGPVNNGRVALFSNKANEKQSCLCNPLDSLCNLVFFRTHEHNYFMGHENYQRVGALLTWGKLGQFSLEKRRLWGDLIVAFQHLKGAYKRAGEGFFERSSCDRIRGSGLKPQEGRFRLDIKKKCFTVRVVRLWDRLLKEDANAPSLKGDAQTVLKL